MKLSGDVIPALTKDNTDRNRTSPFAFTGNRFEFRMVGSSDNIGCPNSLLKAIVAGELSDIADKMESVPADKFDDELKSLLVSIIKEHKRIIFNGNGYSDEWVAEAEKRVVCRTSDPLLTAFRTMQMPRMLLCSRNSAYCPKRKSRLVWKSCWKTMQRPSILKP